MFNGQKVKLKKLTPSDPFAEKWIATDRANFRKTHDSIPIYYDHYPNFGTGWLGIIDKQSEQFVGRAGLLSRSDIFSPAELEVAYVVNKDHRKKGFAKESADLLFGICETESLYLSRVFGYRA